ncbi:beta-lactamase family protein [Myxococcota bacterium]|nr:beta-lactamase family protein [Myxococcota bacterium]
MTTAMPDRKRSTASPFDRLCLTFLSLASTAAIACAGSGTSIHDDPAPAVTHATEFVDSGTSRERFAQLARTLDAHVERGELAGVASLVARGGEVVHFHATGLRDREAGLPLTRDTIFRIYSMTKPITSVAVMILVERGELLLSDPVSKHIPELAGMKVLRAPDSPLGDVVPARREMTVRDLLTHTSGLASSLPGVGTPKAIERAYAEADLRGSQTSLTPEAWIRGVAKVPLVHQPGSKFLYGVSTDVLGHLVAVVSGMPFEAFLRREIFEPLGMVDTGFHVPAEKLDRFAANYGPGPDGKLMLVDAPRTSRYATPPAFQSGAGGLVSTIDDYLRFCEMLRRNGESGGRRILSRKSIELMTLNHLTDGERDVPMLTGWFPGQGFGLGFSVVEELAPGATLGSVGQYGWGGAAGTYFWVDPEEDLIAILMIQLYPPGGIPIIPEFKNGVYQAITD